MDSISNVLRTVADEMDKMGDELDQKYFLLMFQLSSGKFVVIGRPDEAIAGVKAASSLDPKFMEQYENRIIEKMKLDGVEIKH